MSLNATKTRINALLDELSERHGVRILMAVESGSRAWGFESPDSDFDVRFIYQEPTEVILKLFPDRDVIEFETSFNADGTGVPVDMVGWSLPKALRLGVSSNPQLAEWVSNDSFYQVDPDFLTKMAGLTLQSAPRVLGHHYRGLAKRAQHEYLLGKEDPVGKKYLYATRAIFAAQFMVQNPRIGATPPVIFADLRASVQTPENISQEIDELLEWKTQHAEKGGRRRFPVLDQWIAEQIDILDKSVMTIPEHHIDPKIAEGILYDMVFGEPELDAVRLGF